MTFILLQVWPFIIIIIYIIIIYNYYYYYKQATFYTQEFLNDPESRFDTLILATRSFIQNVSYLIGVHFKGDADHSVAANTITLSISNLAPTSKALLEHPRWLLRVKWKNVRCSRARLSPPLDANASHCCGESPEPAPRPRRRDKPLSLLTSMHAGHKKSTHTVTAITFKRTHLCLPFCETQRAAQAGCVRRHQTCLRGPTNGPVRCSCRRFVKLISDHVHRKDRRREDVFSIRLNIDLLLSIIWNTW